MDDDYTSWIGFPKSSKAYVKGIIAFMENAFPVNRKGEEMKCPCKVCVNRNWHLQNVILDHLICNGPSPVHVKWICEVAHSKVEGSDAFMDCETGTGSEHAGMGFEGNLAGMGFEGNLAGMCFEDNLGEMFNCTGRRFRDLENDYEDLTNAEARRFYSRVREGKKPLYPGCTKFSRLSFVISLYHLKCLHGITESAFGELLGLLKDAFPDAHLPSSFNDAKNIIKDLGLTYEKIHACPNNCMLYWAENKDKEKCENCGVSRWVIHEKDENAQETVIHKVPAKVMRYFPLKPRLQRLFMCKDYAKLMTWHAVGRQKDGKLRHPADAQAWKTMDADFPDFPSENRNVSLGVAADGFNPYLSMKSTHSTWPIVLVNYNLPPWLCMKQENLILSTLISGPDSPGNSIDVFMQPLIEELIELWEVGIETYDAFADENFNLHARLLWTISDFPGYAMLSGWSTKGKLGCPVCHYETSSVYLKHSKKMCYMNHKRFLEPEHKWRRDKRRFNGEIEMGQCPEILTGRDIEELLSGYVNKFGLKKKGGNIDSPFKKKSIFFELPYWSRNPLRHNLDPMHIEKNVCDNILGTLLNISGKSKDHISARKDLEDAGIRKPLHPVLCEDGQHLEIRPAVFDLTNKEKDMFCSVLKNAKLPYGCASNISRYVNTKERTVTGYKSHDAHFILHYMLPIAVKETVKPVVALPLIRLSSFLRALWSKVIDLDDLKKLQQEIIEVLCHFEMIFPFAFFDMMVHLLVHLVREVELGGPVHLRNMFPIERYLGKLKAYVRNRSRPEGSIAEGYLAEECVTFCSRFLGGYEATKNTTYSTDFQKCPTQPGHHIGTRRNKDGIIFNLKDVDWKASHRYVLFNSGNYKEVQRLIQEHQGLVDSHASLKKYKRARTHTEEFWLWLQEEVGKMDEASRELEVLALGPNRKARRFTGYVVNGYRFHTTSRDSRCTTQNSGVFVTAETISFASSRDQNPIVGSVNYYGSIEEILELDYWGEFTVVLFKCRWYQEEKDPYGLTRVNFKKLSYKSDPYVLASQVQQVFYVEDPIEKMVHYVIKKMPREWCDTGNMDTVEEDVINYDSHDIDFARGIEIQDDGTSWSRDDIPSRRVPIPDKKSK